jgi:hypothetical protein
MLRKVKGKAEISLDLWIVGLPVAFSNNLPSLIFFSWRKKPAKILSS